jgi:hypothetical protein
MTRSLPARQYYLATALPVLGDLGTPPPLSLAALAAAVEGGSAAAMVRALILEEDLLQRDACLAGERDEPTAVVLSPAQVRGRSPLPGFPAAEQAVTGDGVWTRYWQYMAGLARRSASAFLAAWVPAELALRNALVVARSRTLGLDPARYLVASELAGPLPHDQAAVAAWAAAPDPLAGHQVLLRARWRWVREHEPWYSFGDDELAAYTVRLILLHRWFRALHGDGDGPAGPAGAGPARRAAP